MNVDDLMVHTIRGLVRYGDMDVEDTLELGDNYRKLVTTYRLDGEVVRQSAAVEMLRPLAVGLEQGRV